MTSRPTLAELEPGANFIPRHIGPTEAETREMLRAVGATSLEDFIAKVVPDRIRSKRRLEMKPAMAERTALSYLRTMAERNEVYCSMIGMGYYGTITPKVILRNVLENPGWYTAYTPYQAEVSQGRLEALLNFQQVVIDMTGLELASASLLDEATAAAEAMAMAKRVVKTSANVFFVDADTHPQTIGVIETRAHAFGYEVQIGDPARDLDPAKVFAALLSYPGSSGEVRDYRGIIDRLHGAGALAIMATDLLALALLTPPGELGADIALGSAQRFGVPMGYGGPHAAFFATRDEFKRAMPGRIIGVSVDAEGHRALRMAMQTREQHIRREKATSNICTAQVLLAVIAGFFAVYNGPKGIRKMAERTHRLAEIFASAVAGWGYEVKTRAFFDTVTIHAPGRAHMIWARAKEQRINLRFVDSDHIGISFDQSIRRQELERLLTVFKTDALDVITLDGIDRTLKEVIPPNLRRIIGLSHASGLLDVSLGDRDAALSPPSPGEGRGAGPVDDPAGLLHHEAQCHDRDDPGHLAQLLHAASLRAAGTGAGLHAALRGTRGHAGRDHRLRCRVAAAQCREPGRICRAAGHPRLSRIARARASRRLPHPDLGAWHQSGLRRHGGHEGGGRRLRHERAMSTSPTSRPRPSSTATTWPR